MPAPLVPSSATRPGRGPGSMRRTAPGRRRSRRRSTGRREAHSGAVVESLMLLPHKRAPASAGALYVSSVPRPPPSCGKGRGFLTMPLRSAGTGADGSRRHCMGAHPELEREQAHVDHAYRRLDTLVESAAASAAEARANATTNQQGRRSATSSPPPPPADRGGLRIGDQPLCFGRIDLDDGESLVVGRVAVHDDDLEPLVVDWRAPAAEAFYRATGSDRMRVTRRRHFLNRRRQVVGLDDEVLDADGVQRSARPLVGQGALLLMALEQRRTGRMSDVVATIQREQDEIVRRPWRARSSCREVRARARRRWRCTGPPISSTRTGFASSTTACCSWARTPASSGTWRTFSRRWASRRRPWPRRASCWRACGSAPRTRSRPRR